MEQNKTAVYRIASVISIIGNPLVTISIFILFITSQLYSSLSAVWISSLVIGGVAIPVTVNNYRKVKSGEITNFDMSDREQRHTFYPRLIGLLAIVTLLLFVTQQPINFCIGGLIFLLMIVTSYAINFRLKISMHTSISVFLALTLFKLSFTGGVAMAVFALLISTSRLILKRHTPVEVISGALLGLVFGLINYYK
jgi:membrane-associated phospholipid phosphatase